MLEIAARTRLEAGEPARDRVLDGRVVADVEVEVAERAERPPVAAVQRVALLHVERPRDDLARLPGDDEAEAMPQALARQREEAAVEVLAAPGQLGNRPPVELEHAGEQRVGNLVTGVHRDVDAVGGQLAALAPDLVSPLAPQARQVVLEGAEARVRPVVLVSGAAEPAALSERCRLLRAAEVHVDRGQPLAAAGLLERLGDAIDDGGALGLARQETLPRDRRER